MSIWILALLILAGVSLAGWRQGAIRAAISFAGILVAALLAVPVGKMIHPLLPHLGASNPILAWALAPLFGFILVSIVFKVVAFTVHRKADVYYRYKAGDLRQALWLRLNSRLGICVGLLNGAVYFVLVCFVIFNLSYGTTQAASASQTQPALIRLTNRLGTDLQSTGMARAASAVGTLPTMYYKLADLSGFLLQQRDQKIGQRFADYPALTSLWERDDMQKLVGDATLTHSLAAGATLGDIFKEPPVQEFLKNKELTSLVLGILETNMNDLTNYLQTGKSPKYDGQKILGRWQLNVGVTLAWLRQANPKIQAKDMRAVRALWSQAYAQTTVLVTPDNQVFVKNLPKFQSQPGQPPFQLENWNGDWSRDGSNYTLHITLNGEDKFLNATTDDGLRLSVKDGRTLLVFDRVN
ncbi:MAG TPA: CvpA family protein [Verrucomicrobiae bacterium]